MSLRALIGTVLAGIMLGLIFTVLTSQTQLLSLQVWLGATAAWVMTLIALRALGQLPPSTPAFRSLFVKPDAAPHRPKRPTPLVRADRTIVQSIGDPRRFVKVLRPRLQALAPADSTSWLIDDRVMDRAPTHAELDDFFDKLQGTE